MDEIRVRLNGLLTPASPRPRISVSVDAIGVYRDGRDVTGSVRLGPSETDGRAAEATAALLRRTLVAAEAAGVRLQSVVSDTESVSVRRRGVAEDLGGPVRLLARVETAGGPVLLGTEAAAHDEAVLPFARLGELPADLKPADLAPPGLSPVAGVRDLPIVLRPEVAAVLVAGAVFSLTSTKGRANARRLIGRKVLPGLTLTEGGGTLVDAGVVVPFEHEPRRVWDHDRQSTVDDLLTRAGASGVERALPGEFVELVWCVEGLQRYHSDGTVRLQCLARTGDDWSVLTLAGSPIRLLRHVTGVHGPLTTVFTDSVVTTQSLVLTSARTIEGKGNGRIIEE